MRPNGTSRPENSHASGTARGCPRRNLTGRLSLYTNPRTQTHYVDFNVANPTYDPRRLDRRSRSSSRPRGRSPIALGNGYSAYGRGYQAPIGVSQEGVVSLGALVRRSATRGSSSGRSPRASSVTGRIHLHLEDGAYVARATPVSRGAFPLDP